jgi:3-deoxy-D-manno-octulosonic-acid transferase
VFLGDTMGELMTFYAAADVAFVGGSLSAIGGHNLLEPASLGIPVVTGPHNENAADIFALLVARGAASVVADAAGVAGEVCRLFRDPADRQRRGAAGQAAINDNSGALERLLALIDPLVPDDAG